MLSHLRIQNFAIIDHVELDFHRGLNTITGETGAGKSIVIEAMSLALGSRADATFVRSGEKRAVVQLTGTHNNEEFVITREISASGKNLCKINGEIVTLSYLNELCKKLADLHGQYDHQSLLNPEYHIKLVDLYQKETIEPAKTQVASLYSRYKDLSAQLKKLLSAAAEDQRKRDFMLFELDEIQKANLIPEEDKQLEEEISVLQNSENIYESLSQAYEQSNGESFSTLSNLKKSMDLIGEVASFSDQLSNIHQNMTENYYALEDLCTQIRDCRDNMVFSPDQLDAAITRLEILNRLKRKHGGSLSTVIEYGKEIEKRLQQIENLEQSELQLREDLNNCEMELKAANQQLSTLRKSAAVQLEKSILQELEELNFQHAKLSIAFKENPHYTESGTDLAEFLISPNKGEDLKPLSKIASGGEMSRIMLAFKKIVGEYDAIPTMIFDEIDSGISGVTASIVGKKLKQIAEKRQIICITHLPQIAAFGDFHYKIEKKTDQQQTYTTVKELNTEEKTEEIARLLGGMQITPTTLESARELMRQSHS